MTAIEKLKYGAKMKKSIHRMLFYVLVLALCSIFLMPFIVMLTTSFKTGSDAFTIPVKIEIYGEYGFYYNPFCDRTAFGDSDDCLFLVENQLARGQSYFRFVDGCNDDTVYSNNDSAVPGIFAAPYDEYLYPIDPSGILRKTIFYYHYTSVFQRYSQFINGSGAY